MVELILKIIGIIGLTILLTKVIGPIFDKPFENAFYFKIKRLAKTDKKIISWIEAHFNIYIYMFAFIFIVILIISYIESNF